MKNTMIPRLYLNCPGLAMFLGGETQARVFYAVLEFPGNLRRILETVNASPNHDAVAYTTVATVANKLCDKGILKRTKINSAKTEYTYRAAVTEDELITMCIDAVVRALMREYPEYISRSCFETVNQNPVKADV